MPRNAMRNPGSGGARTGTPGQSYSNRTDLNVPKLPVTTAPGQPYGQATQQAQAQKAVPMASGPPAAAVVQSQQQAANPGPMPQPPAQGQTQLPSLYAPSVRPGESVTAGAAGGPGAGPEAMIGYQPTRLSQTIAQIAQASNNPDLMALAAHAQQQGS